MFLNPGGHYSKDLAAPAINFLSLRYPLNLSIKLAVTDVESIAFGANLSVSTIFIAFIAFGGLICSGKAPIIASLKLVISSKNQDKSC